MTIPVRLHTCGMSCGDASVARDVQHDDPGRVALNVDEARRKVDQHGEVGVRQKVAIHLQEEEVKPRPDVMTPHQTRRFSLAKHRLGRHCWKMPEN